MVKKRIRDIFNKRPFSIVLFVNGIAIIKEDVQKVLSASPITVLVGAAGVGKTSLVEAVILCEAEWLNFTQRPRAIASAIDTTDKRLVVMDDLMDGKSQGIRERVFKNIDTVVRDSYAGRGPIMILTAERNALRRQAESCLQRMICINADSILIGENMDTLSWLQENKEEVRQIIQEFDRWYNWNEYDFKEMLREYRRKYALKGTPRQVDLVFSFYAAMVVMQDFFEQQGYEIYDEKMIAQNIEFLLKPEDLKEIELGIDTKKILDEVISDGKIVPQFVRKEEICSEYLAGKCLNYSLNCSETCYAISPEEEEGINPQNLILNLEEGYNAVMLQDIHDIKECPKNIPNGPVLIVSNEALRHNINDVLLKKSIINKQHIPQWSDILIHKKVA